ncbi:MAG: transcriptional regulator PpsR [Myxococcota bacterium]
MFEHASDYLSGLEPQQVARLLGVAADVALVLDDGVVRDVSINAPELAGEDYPRQWLGRSWVETVTAESRPKIEELLDRAASREAASGMAVHAWRQVNHPSSRGLDLPVSYAAIRLPNSDRVFAFGRDQRTISLLQQRLIEAHQSVERDYARLRSAEARYLALFHSIGAPVLIVDPETLIVGEANPAATRMLGFSSGEGRPRALDTLFDERSAAAVRKLVLDVASDGVSTSTEARTPNGETCLLSASVFRDASAERIVVSILERRSESAVAASADPASRSARSDRHRLFSMLQDLPDGLVVVGSDLRVRVANRAFKELIGLGARHREVGIWLPDHLGRSTTELNVLVSNLKSQGTVRNFLTVARDVLGREEEVEISAVVADPAEGGTGVAYGLAVRRIARRLRTDAPITEALPRSADQLTGLVGRVPLRQIVQETTDFIERLCIEAALGVTNDNRASAADMLGLSRQALYMKLRRFGIDR